MVNVGARSVSDAKRVMAEAEPDVVEAVISGAMTLHAAVQTISNVIVEIVEEVEAPAPTALCCQQCGKYRPPLWVTHDFRKVCAECFHGDELTAERGSIFIRKCATCGKEFSKDGLIDGVCVFCQWEASEPKAEPSEDAEVDTSQPAAKPADGVYQCDDCGVLAEKENLYITDGITRCPECYSARKVEAPAKPEPEMNDAMVDSITKKLHQEKQDSEPETKDADPGLLAGQPEKNPPRAKCEKCGRKTDGGLLHEGVCLDCRQQDIPVSFRARVDRLAKENGWTQLPSFKREVPTIFVRERVLFVFFHSYDARTRISSEVLTALQGAGAECHHWPKDEWQQVESTLTAPAQPLAGGQEVRE